MIEKSLCSRYINTKSHACKWSQKGKTPKTRGGVWHISRVPSSTESKVPGPCVACLVIFPFAIAPVRGSYGLTDGLYDKSNVSRHAAIELYLVLVERARFMATNIDNH